MFHPLGGVHAHIKRRRLARAFHDIASPSPRAPKIAEIAYRWGFRDQAGFSRSFRDMFGASPSETRAEGRERYARQLASGSPQQGGDAALGGWIRDLMKF